MHPRRGIIQVFCVLLISISGLLLGLSQGAWQLTTIAILGGVLGYVLVDRMRLFQLTGWLANTASVLILIFAMRDFYGGDSAVKLISVGQLLIYLQTVLMFQEKTPRLYWQVLVLSLLQVVVAAIFNLNFEGGMLFILYFALAGAMMMLQCDLTQWYEVERANSSNLKSAKGRAELVRAGVQVERGGVPCMVFEHQVPASYTRLLQHLMPWLGVAFAFSIVLFYNVPRNESAWLGPGYKTVTGTGQSHKLNLDERGHIPQRGRLVLRSWFTEPNSEDRIKLKERPYFRGMPLSRLVVEDNVTSWQAPHDAVFYQFSYRRPTRNSDNAKRRVIQNFAIESTNDPLLYATTPFFRVRATSKEVEYCMDLAALTRRRRGDHAEMATYNYEMGVILDEEDRPLKSWPYVAEDAEVPYVTLEENKGEYDSLVHLDPTRYESLVAEAKRIAIRYSSQGDYQLARSMSNIFTETNGFGYTLDFRTIERDESLDPIEDFYRNHRTGHCQLYASALAIMLRSQNIPARVVIGFHGGEFNGPNNCYMVRERHAHAWVEAYIPPEECVSEWMEQGAAGPGGAWVLLDPTKGVYADDTIVVNGDSLELARTLWQDYVLGLDDENQLEPITVSSSQILGLFDLSNWKNFGESTASRFNSSPVLRVLAIVVAVGLFGFILFRRLTLNSRIVQKKSQQPVSRIRKLVGEALYWLSPDLGTWVMGNVYTQRIVPFYDRMIRVLQRNHQLERKPNQTHREFANSVGEHFSEHPNASSIHASVRRITEAFYSVRFGNQDLDPAILLDIEHVYGELEHQLQVKA